MNAFLCGVRRLVAALLDSDSSLLLKSTVTSHGGDHIRVYPTCICIVLFGWMHCLSALTFSHRTDAYQTHQPVLYEMAMQTCGPIIEFGCGYGSTELLHEICKADKRLLISLDDNWEWLNIFKEKYKCDSEWHKFLFVPGKPSKDSPSAEHWIKFMHTCDLLQKSSFDICFIDQSPWQGRVETLKYMKDKARFFIIHDCDYFPRVGLFGKTIIPIIGNSPGIFDFSDVFQCFKVYFPIYPGRGWFGPPTLVGTDFEEILPEIDFNNY